MEFMKVLMGPSWSGEVCGQVKKNDFIGLGIIEMYRIGAPLAVTVLHKNHATKAEGFFTAHNGGISLTDGRSRYS